MTEIKSALEIALERTRSIQGDKETLKMNELKNEGKKLASGYLDPFSETDEHSVISKLKALPDAEKNPFTEGFSSVLIANLSLPSDDSFTEKLKKLEKGFQALVKERKQVAYLFQQIHQFFEQYLRARVLLEGGVMEQYEPKLREMERLLEKQMGAKIHLTHEQDKEYLSVLAKNYGRLDEQYNRALQQIRDQLKQMVPVS